MKKKFALLLSLVAVLAVSTFVVVQGQDDYKHDCCTNFAYFYNDKYEINFDELNSWMVCCGDTRREFTIFHANVIGGRPGQFTNAWVEFCPSCFVVWSLTDIGWNCIRHRAYLPHGWWTFLGRHDLEIDPCCIPEDLFFEDVE